MRRILRYFIYAFIMLNIYFLISCCSAGKATDTTRVPETEDINREISAVIVLDEETDIQSTWTSEYLLPTLPGAFLANDFTFKKGVVKLEKTTFQFGQRVIEKTLIDRHATYAIYRIGIEILSLKGDPNLTNAYSHTESVTTTFSLNDLVKNGKVLYQPERYALTSAIRSKAAARGQAGLSSLEYLNNGLFKAEVIIRY